jgi:hypothetical protein
MPFLEFWMRVGPWLFVAMILFGVIGNFLLRRNLAGRAAPTITKILCYLSLPNGRSHSIGEEFASSADSTSGATPSVTDFRKEMARMVIEGTAKITGKELTAEERERLSKELLEGAGPGLGVAPK